MPGPERQRIDKWLFFARAVKSRSLAAKLVEGGGIRLNRLKIDHPSQQVKAGDVLTVTLDRRILVWRIVDTGTRRGPAEEARTLYEDLSPPAEARAEAAAGQAAARDPGAGRPTKRERRDLERWRGD